jgi:hypothetical protein
LLLHGDGTLLLFWFGFGMGNSYAVPTGGCKLTTDNIYYLISAA